MISPAIHFSGNCKEAIEFYEEVFQATDKHIEFYHNAPSNSGMNITEATKDYVMHAGMTICGTHVNFSDTTDPVLAGNMICLNVFFQTSDQVVHAYERLKEGGKIIVELGPQFFSSMYASVVDRYGVNWQLICES